MHPNQVEANGLIVQAVANDAKMLSIQISLEKSIRSHRARLAKRRAAIASKVYRDLRNRDRRDFLNRLASAGIPDKHNPTHRF